MKPQNKRPMRILDHMPQVDRYWVLNGAVVIGPYTVDSLDTLVVTDVLSPDTLIALYGTDVFKPVRAWPFFTVLFPERKLSLKAIAPAPALPAQPYTAYDMVVEGTTTPPLPGSKARISTHAELDACLARDPHDPFALSVVAQIHALKQAEQMTSAAAITAYFNDVSILQAKIATAVAIPYDVARQEIRRMAVFFGVVVGLYLVIFSRWATPGFERNLVMAALCFHVASSLVLYRFGWHIQRAMDLHPIATAYGMLAGSWFLSLTCMSGFLWAFRISEGSYWDTLLRCLSILF
jgi:hypothetical protein